MKLNALKPYFPQAFGANSIKSLVIAVLIYAVVAWVAGIVISLLSWIPIVSFILGVLGWVIDIYCVVGIILSILVFLKIVK